MTVKVVFRADASLQMGSGHIMRCLTLADALAETGVRSHFICREHPGNLNEFIRGKGHTVHALQFYQNEYFSKLNDDELLEHASWLTTSQEIDVHESLDILQQIKPDWLIVDHYALDSQWHTQLRPYCGKIMVIDDLADRQHDCDVLLDQTYGRNEEDYASVVPKNCKCLCGAQYALLRPEFSKWREYSLNRRQEGKLEQLLINLGGVDKDNVTTRILSSLALNRSILAKNFKINVILGASAPWIMQVRKEAERMPWPTSVDVGVGNMAEHIAKSDLVIGGAGSTSWERCCLGVPTIMIVLAKNQMKIAKNLFNSKAVLILELNKLETQLIELLEKITPNLLLMSASASAITNGTGCSKVIQYLNNNQ